MRFMVLLILCLSLGPVWGHQEGIHVPLPGVSSQNDLTGPISNFSLINRNRSQFQNTVNNLGTIIPSGNININGAIPFNYTPDADSENVLTNPFDPNCLIGILPENDLMMFSTLSGQCDTLASQGSYDVDTPIRQNLQHFRQVCNCYHSGTSVESIEFRERFPPLGDAARDHARNISERFFDGVIRDPAQATRNVQIEQNQLQQLANGLQEQASFMSSNDSEAQQLAQGYAQNYLVQGSEEQQAIASAQNRLRAKFTKHGLGTPPPITLSPAQIALQGIRAQNPPNSCVSPRDFSAFRQFPTDQKFYDDMAGAEFNKRDWNFDDLKKELTDATKGSLLTIQEAEKIPRLGIIIRRLDFLQRNPLLKFTLASNRDIEKRRIFDVIKSTFKGSQAESLRNSASFQQGIRSIMNDPVSRDKIAKEAKERSLATFKSNIRRIDDRAITPRVFSSADLQTFTPSFMESVRNEYRSDLNRTNQFGLPSLPTPNTDALSLTGYSSTFNTFARDIYRNRRLEAVSRACPVIQKPSLLEDEYLVQALERRWTEEVSAAPTSDPDVINFSRFAGEICFGRSAIANGKIESFDSWMATRCPSGSADPFCGLDKRRQQVAAFVRAHPIPESNPDIAKSFAGFVENFTFVDFTAEQARIASEVGRTSFAADRQESQNTFSGRYVVDNNARLGSSTLTSLSQSNLDGGARNSSQIRAATSGAAATTIRDSGTASQSNVMAAGAVLAPGLSDAQGVAARAAVTTPEVVARTRELQRGESEVSLMRTQLAELTESLARERAAAGTQQENNALNELTARFAALDEKIKLRETENERLRTRLRESERESRNRSPANDEDDQVDQDEQDDQNDEPRPSVNGTTVAANQAEVQQNAPASNITSLSGNASLGSSSKNVPSQISEGARNLQRYGVNSVALQGSIVVADPGRSVDIQKLRSDAGENVIQVPVTLEEFNLLPDTEKQRYFEQARGFTGTVVKLTFSNGEAFLVRQGQNLALVPSTEASVLRAPAGERRWSLSTIREELNNAGN